MKKLLLAAAATAAFSSSAFASDDYYLRADAGYNKFNDIKHDGVTAKGKYSPSMEFGVGYGVMDNVRAELVYGYHFNPTHKANYGGLSEKSKATIQTLMAKGYVDVADLGVAQVFAGAGLGMAQKEVKHSYSDGGDSAKEKKNNTFTWSLALGSAFDVADGVKVDLQYNYQDFGKTSGKIKGGYTTNTKDKYNSHAVKLGARFAL